MFVKIKKTCMKMGCNKLTNGAYCEEHRKEDVAERKNNCRHDYQQWYSYADWKKARIQHLIKNPLCVQCEKEGRLTPANVVDHIIPHRGDKKLFWDKDNWQSLCKSCHDKKTANEI
jgi:5-methylcytosine-specific restriction protein A